jgi:hypothetical protein
MPAAIAHDKLVSRDEMPLISVRAILKPSTAQATVMPDLLAHLFSQVVFSGAIVSEDLGTSGEPNRKGLSQQH